MKPHSHFLILAAAVAASLSTTAAAAAQTVRGNGLLVDVDWVAERLDDGLIILQVGPEELFEREHIEGAQHVTHVDLSARSADTGGVPLELPAVDDLRDRLESLGISDDSRIVVVPSDGWITPAARVVFTLDYAGLGDRTVLLDGGLEAWKAAGYPVTTEVAAVERGTLTRRPIERVVSADWVERNATGAGVTLLDARAGAFYDGVRDDHGAVGHIPGARSMPVYDLVLEDEETGAVTLRSDDALLERLRRAGVGEGDLVVGYCHIGQFATLVLLAARATGHEVRLYDGSMHEWAMLERPTETSR